MFFAAAILALLSAVAFVMSRPHQDPPFSHDPRFVATTTPSFRRAPPDATVTEQAFAWWNQTKLRFQKRRPQTYSFRSRATSPYLIGETLNLCMEVTGVRYLILKEVAAGKCEYGFTNTLNGAQWVAVVTDALQHGQPEWRDPHTKAIRKENLVLLTNDARTVVVLTKEMARDFQSKKAH